MSTGLDQSHYGSAPVEIFEFRQGTTAWRYTSSDAPVVHLGHTYEPTAIARKGISHTREASSGSVELTLPRTDPVALLFVGPLPPASVSLTIWQLQRQDLQGAVIFSGSVASVSHEGPLSTLKCTSLEAMLQRSTPGLVFQSQCNLVLYGARCGVTAADYLTSGSVIAIDGLEVRVSNVALHADGWFRTGWIQNATGERRFITSHVGQLLTLNAPFKTLAVSDLVSVYAGCQRTEADCLAKFDNLARFFGFPRMPNRNPYTGSV